MTTRRNLLAGGVAALILAGSLGASAAPGMRVRLGSTGVAAPQKALLTSGTLNALTGSSLSAYSAFNGPANLTNTVEAAASPKWRGATGTVSLLNIHVATNTRAAASVFTIRKNGAATGITITIGAGVTGNLTEAVPASFTLADGDTYCAEMTVGAGGGNLIYNASCQVAMAGQVSTQLAQTAFPNTVAAGVTNYIAPVGISGANASESPRQFPALETCTDDQLQVYVTANTLSGSCVFTYRKAGVDQTLTLTVGAGLTGFFEDADTGHAVTLAADDLATIKVAAGAGTGSITFLLVSVRRTGTVTNRTSVYCSAGTTSAATTQRFNPFGGGTSGLTTETESQLVMPFASTMSRLTVRVTANGSSGTVNTRLRANGVSLTNTAGITGAGTSIGKDTTNTDAVAAGALVAFNSAAPNSSNITWQSYGILVTAT